MNSTFVKNNMLVNVRVRTNEEDECGVCLTPWCQNDVCGKSMSRTSCCYQGICSACVVKLSVVCGCHESCNQIVFLCPFCRSISRTEPKTIFVGHKRPCKACKELIAPQQESADTQTC